MICAQKQTCFCIATTVLLLLILPACNQSTYDKGYEVAWDEEELPFYASQQEKAGYRRVLMMLECMMKVITME
jgi:hypothetical protein